MKGKKMIKGLGIVLGIIFLCSYFMGMSGYYEYHLQNQKNLTEEQIKQFEQDVKEGKEVDLNQYLQTTEIDYSNKLTRTTSELSIKFNDYLKSFLASAFRTFGRLVS